MTIWLICKSFVAAPALPCLLVDCLFFIVYSFWCSDMVVFQADRAQNAFDAGGAPLEELTALHQIL